MAHPRLLAPRLLAPRLLAIGITLAVVGAATGAGLWVAEQAAFVITTDARVRARMVTLSAEIAGQIVDMPAHAGNRISTGDLLAQLDSEKARLALGAAMLNLKALEIGVEREKVKASIQQASGAARIAAGHAALDAAGADVSAANAMLLRAGADHARTARLHVSGLIAQAGMERSDTALEVARQTTARATAELSEKRAGLGEAQAESREAELAQRDAERMAASAHALRQRIALLKVELHQHSLLSPLDGVIDEVFAEPGEHVAAGERLALAHDDRAMWLEAHIKEPDLPRIATGATVEIHLDAARAACNGTVERIGAAAMAEFALIPNANPAGVFTKITQRVPIRIRMLDCKGTRPGAMATLRIRAS